MKGKFGRVLGDFDTIYGESVSGKLMTEGHAVVYMGGSKDATQSQHIENRHKLVDNGTVILPEGYTVTKKRRYSKKLYAHGADRKQLVN